MSRLLQIGLVVAGILAVAIGCILLFALGLTTGDASGTTNEGPAWIRLNYGIPWTLSFAAFLSMVPCMPFTLILRARHIAGIVVVVLSVAACVLGSLLWYWNQFLGWPWPAGLVMASVACLCCGAAAVSSQDRWRGLAVLGLSGVLCLAAAALALKQVLGA